MAKKKITHEELRDELESGASCQQIADKYGMNIRNVQIRKRRLKETGWDPDNDRHYKNPESQVARGV